MDKLGNDNPLFEPFSVRDRSVPSVLYRLDPIPEEFRAQLVHILNRLVGTQVYDTTLITRKGNLQSADLWRELAKDGAEALGRLSLSNQQPDGPYSLVHYLMSSDASTTTDVLDIIEVVINRCRSWSNSVDL